jgi:hypothetical protein
MPESSGDTAAEAARLFIGFAVGFLFGLMFSALIAWSIMDPILH